RGHAGGVELRHRGAATSAARPVLSSLPAARSNREETMRTWLIVAHHTLVDEHVLDHARALLDEEPCRFHLVVPVRHPTNHAWTEGEVEAVARRRLESGLAAFRDL